MKPKLINPFNFDDSLESQERLARLSMMLGLSNQLESLAHDIRSPVQTLMMAMSAMQMENVDAGIIDSSRSLTEKATARIERTLAGLRFPDLSERDPEPLALSFIMDETLELWPVVRARGQTRCHVEVPADLPAIVCANGVIRYALMQLYLNAFEAVSGAVNAEVMVRAYQQADKVVVEVMDNGAGIPKEIAGQIFTPFLTTKSIESHAGVGLSVSVNLLERTDSTIELASDREGDGACFRLLLPCLKDVT
jgi:two-component system sensor kinase FixL